MRLIQNVKRKSLAGGATVVVAAMILSTALATDALAARGIGAAGHGRGQMSTPLLNQAPAMPPPVFNQSTPFTVPTTPETPVSPGSPGSIFGNGPTGAL